jgi:hypothetical protein
MTLLMSDLVRKSLFAYPHLYRAVCVDLMTFKYFNLFLLVLCAGVFCWWRNDFGFFFVWLIKSKNEIKMKCMK